LRILKLRRSIILAKNSGGYDESEAIYGGADNWFIAGGRSKVFTV
jgi:hypothetical protein